MSITYISEQEPTSEQVPNLETVPQTVQSNNFLEKISFTILLVTIFLTPLVFISTNYAPIDTAKSLLIVFGVLLSSIIYVLSSIRHKNFQVLKNSVTICGAGIVIATLVSTFLSDSIQRSFLGQGFELGTASFIFVLFLAALLVSKLVAKNKDRLMYVYSSVLISFTVLGIFQIIRLFVDSSILNFGILTSATSTLVGRWDDLAVFSGSILLLSFFALRHLNAQNGIRVFLYCTLALSIVLTVIVNSVLVWGTLLVVLVGYGIYHFLSSSTKRFSITTLILIILAIVCIFKGPDIVVSIGITTQVDATELTLPWQLTLDVASDTIKEKPLFGAGPNRFTNQYMLHKPAVVNSSDFWGIEFTNGFGLIPTFIVTGGIIGLILWILFFVFFTKSGLRLLKKSNQENNDNFATVSTFLVSVFLLIISIIFTPSHAILFLTAIFIGLFLSELPSSKQLYIHSKKFSVVLYALVLIILIFWALAYVKKAVALSYFRSGITTLSSAKSTTDIDVAESKFKSALSWDRSDIYLQALAEVDVIKIQSLAQKLQEASKASKEIDQTSLNSLNTLIEESISFARSAIALDPTNYYNYLSEARVSELALSLQIKNAYENVKNAYLSALVYNPYNPAIYLNLARVEASQNKFDEAQKYIGAALQIKPNYTEAIFLLSQIQVNKGQIKDAITSVQFAIQTNPNNSLLYFQLGLLQYNDKNYQGAVDALQNAIKINSQYANARYFLGLAYARLGNVANAIVQFENLATTNPENQEVATILANLKSGKSVFNDILPPSDSKPEKRSTLPVKEKASSSKKVSN